MNSPGLGGNVGFWQPFANLFQFQWNWKYLGALILIVFVVNAIESYNPQWAWVFVMVVLAGVLLVQNRKRTP